MSSHMRKQPDFQRGDRVMIVTQRWRGQNQRGTVRRIEWTIGNWRYAVRLDGRSRHLTRYNATSLRLLSAIELLGELACPS